MGGGVGGVGGGGGGRYSLALHCGGALWTQRVHQAGDVHKLCKCVLYKGLQSTDLHVLLQSSAQMFKVQDSL